MENCCEYANVNGVWKTEPSTTPDILYLYKNGEQYTSVTGGWEYSAHEIFLKNGWYIRLAPVYESSYIRHWCGFESPYSNPSSVIISQGVQTPLATKNKINTTGYKYLNVRMEHKREVNGDDYGYNQYGTITLTDNYTYSSKRVGVSYDRAFIGTKTYKVDISSVTVPCYVKIETLIGNGYYKYLQDNRIYEVWLSKS